MDNYRRQLIERIKDSSNWPSFDRPDFLDDLNNMADAALQKATVEGCLAALLIYHQLCEELVSLVLESAQFFIQVSIFPAEISFSRKKRRMFGQLIEELRATVSFEGKNELGAFHFGWGIPCRDWVSQPSGRGDLAPTNPFETHPNEFIERCLELNKHRIDIVHRLTKRTTLLDVQSQALEAKELFDEIYELFEGSYDFFQVCLSNYRRHTDWDDFLED